VRIFDRVLSAVLGLALMVGGLVTAIEIVLAGLGRSPWLLPHDRWAEIARTTTWSDTDVRPIAAGLIAAGVVLLVVEAARRRPEALTLAAGASGVVSELDRQGVERWMVQRVERVEGVSAAGVRIGSRSVVVEATSVGRDIATVDRGVREAAAGGLESLGLDRTPGLRVKVRPRSDR